MGKLQASLLALAMNEDSFKGCGRLKGRGRGRGGPTRGMIEGGSQNQSLVGANQCAYCWKERHWKNGCPNQKTKNEGNPRITDDLIVLEDSDFN